MPQITSRPRSNSLPVAPQQSEAPPLRRSSSTADMSSLLSLDRKEPQTKRDSALRYTFSLAADGLLRPRTSGTLDALETRFDRLTPQLKFSLGAQANLEAVDFATSVAGAVFADTFIGWGLTFQTYVADKAWQVMGPRIGDTGWWRTVNRPWTHKLVSTSLPVRRLFTYGGMATSVAMQGLRAYNLLRSSEGPLHTSHLSLVRSELQNHRGDDAAQVERICHQAILACVDAGRPVPTDIVCDMAEALWQRELFAEAQTWAELALSRGENSQMLRLLGVVHLERGAYRDLEKVLAKLPPKEANASHWRLLTGRLRVCEGRLEEAAVAFRDALHGRVHTEAQIRLSSVLEALGRLNDAAEVMSDYDPTKALQDEALSVLTATLALAGQYETTEQLLLYREASKAGKSLRPSQRRLLSWVQYSQEKYTFAGLNFERYLAERPHDLAERRALLMVEGRQKKSHVPAYDALAWATANERDMREDSCVITLDPYIELKRPVILQKGNGRYLFEYDALVRHHDRVLKDFFGSGPFQGEQLVRLPPFVPSRWSRMSDAVRGWVKPENRAE